MENGVRTVCSLRYCLSVTCIAGWMSCARLDCVMMRSEKDELCEDVVCGRHLRTRWITAPMRWQRKMFGHHKDFQIWRLSVTTFCKTISWY